MDTTDQTGFRIKSMDFPYGIHVGMDKSNGFPVQREQLDIEVSCSWNAIATV